MADAVVKIYGASDDLIEIEGTVRGCDEYNYESGIILFEPSGDRLTITYDEWSGFWKITPVHVTGALRMDVERMKDVAPEDLYSDTATVSGEIERVRFFKNWPLTKTEIEERVMSRIHRGLSDDEMMAVWKALGEP